MDEDFLKDLATRSTILRDFVELRKKQDFASKLVAAYPGVTGRERAVKRILLRLLQMARNYKIPLD